MKQGNFKNVSNDSLTSSSLSSKLNTLQSQVDALSQTSVGSSQLTTLTNTVTSLTSQVDTAVEEVENVGNRVTTLEGSFSVLDNEKLDLTGGTLSGDVVVSGEQKVTTVSHGSIVVEDNTQRLTITPSSIEVESLVDSSNSAVSFSPVQPGGLDSEVQFNDNGSFGGSSDFVFNKNTGELVVKSINSEAFYLNGVAQTFGGSTPSGSNTQLQFNNNGSFGGSSKMTFDGSNLNLNCPIVVTSSNYITFTAGGRLTTASSNSLFLNNDKTSGDCRINTGSSSSNLYLDNGSLFVQSGNVGIKKTSASYPLDVVGDINLTGSLRVNGVIQSFGSSSGSSSYDAWYYNITTNYQITMTYSTYSFLKVPNYATQTSYGSVTGLTYDSSTGKYTNTSSSSKLIKVTFSFYFGNPTNSSGTANLTSSQLNAITITTVGTDAYGRVESTWQSSGTFGEPSSYSVCSGVLFYSAPAGGSFGLGHKMSYNYQYASVQFKCYLWGSMLLEVLT